MVAHFLAVAEREGVLAIGRDDLLRYAGPSQIIACTLAFRLFTRAFADLSPGRPPQRESILVVTAFTGEGMIDCIEMITRGRSRGNRLVIDPGRTRAEAPVSPTGPFHFEIFIDGHGRAYWPRPGFFEEPFADMVSRFQDGGGSPTEQASYFAFKHALFGRLMGAEDDALFASAPTAQGS